MKTWILGAVLFLLVSCDKDRLVHYQRVVINQSDYDIWLVHPDTLNACNFDSVLIASKTEYELERFDPPQRTRQSVDDYKDCPFVCMDSLTSRISGHDSLQLNVSTRGGTSSWVYSRGITGLGQNGTCACYLTIDNTDIN